MQIANRLYIELPQSKLHKVWQTSGCELTR